MTRNDVRRLVCITALGVGDSRGHGGFVFDRLFLPLLLSHAYKDEDRQEAAIRASSLDWVVVRTAMLTNDPARGSVRAVTDLAGVQHLVEANSRYPVVKDAENSRLICGFIAHQRRNDSV
jgi:NAD(P)H-binding